MDGLPTFLLYAGSVLVIGAGLRIVTDTQWMAVYRFGRFQGYRGPGFRWVVPFIDQCVRFNPDKLVPDWKLSPDPLDGTI